MIKKLFNFSSAHHGVGILVITALLFSGCDSAKPAKQATATTQMGGAMQGAPLMLSTAPSTLAGSGEIGAVDATGAAASFNYPSGITTDGSNLYVSDTANQIIRKIEIATGAVTTLAGSGKTGSLDARGMTASFSHPHGITTDGSNLYVADTWNSKIRKIEIATGLVTTLVGSGIAGSLDATGVGASLNYPYGLTTDGSNLYVADTSNHKIRKIVIATGAVTTLAGTGAPGQVDGTGTAAAFRYPKDITTDGSNLYVADTSNHKIRKIVIATGEVTTLAGSEKQGSDDGAGAAATFKYPEGITTDGSNLYVADTDNQKIRKIVIATGVVTTLDCSTVGSVDVTDKGVLFSQPEDITSDGNYLYVADTNHHKIRRIK